MVLYMVVNKNRFYFRDWYKLYLYPFLNDYFGFIFDKFTEVD